MRIPVPLNALRAFEAVARHGSIKAAAAELAVTPSAVSHQLRILERALDLQLLHRENARVTPTEAGRRLASELSAGFQRIAEAVGGLRESRRAGPLRLSVLPTFAIHWLSPRLATYPFERAGFELSITTSQALVDLAAGEADAAVRHGRGGWPGLVCDRLFDETVTLLAAPDFVARTGAADARAAVGRAHLFLSQHRREAFAAWNAALPGGPVQPAAVTIVDSVGIALRAAIDGAGITLAGCEIAATDLAAGRLSPLFEHRLADGAAYYLVYPEALREDRRIRGFREWLLARLELPDQSSPSQ